MNNILKRFPVNLKKYRKKVGLTQDELAEKLGVQSQTIYKYENAIIFPGGDKIECLLEVLDITPNQLFYDETYIFEDEKKLLDLRKDRKYILTEIERIRKEENHLDEYDNEIEAMATPEQMAKKFLIGHMQLENKTIEELVEVYDFLQQKEIIKTMV